MTTLDRWKSELQAILESDAKTPLLTDDELDRLIECARRIEEKYLPTDVIRLDRSMVAN